MFSRRLRAERTNRKPTVATLFESLEPRTHCSSTASGFSSHNDINAFTPTTVTLTGVPANTHVTINATLTYNSGPNEVFETPAELMVIKTSAGRFRQVADGRTQTYTFTTKADNEV